MGSLVKTYNGEAVRFDADGYLHATSLASKYGKQLSNFLRSPETQTYKAAVASSFKLKEEDLIRAVQGSRFGTRLHPKLAVFFARWLDPAFAVWCDAQIDDIVRGKSIIVPIEPPTPTSEKFAAIRFAVDLIRDIPGVDPGMLGACALSLVQKETGANVDQLRRALPAPAQVELPENPTMLGERVGLSAKAVNRGLCEAGLQEWNGDHWEMTPAGRKVGTLRPFQNPANGHSGWQLLWYPSVLDQVGIAA